MVQFYVKIVPYGTGYDVSVESGKARYCLVHCDSTEDAIDKAKDLSKHFKGARIVEVDKGVDR